MRDVRIDNCKGMLIFLVVFGHLLELCNAGRLGNITYKLIYIFHMPAFIFLMGWVSKPSAKRVIKSIGLYIVFRIMYFVFNCTINGYPMKFYFSSRPYWLLWFTLVEIYYSVLCVIINKYRVNINVLFCYQLQYPYWLGMYRKSDMILVSQGH